MKTLGGTSRGVPKRMSRKPIKGVRRLYSNPKIGFARNVFLSNGNPSSNHGKMVLFKSLGDSITMPITGEYKVSATFNVVDLSTFLADSDLRENSFEDDENDAIVPA